MNARAGIGDINADFLVYIANRPPIAPFESLQEVLCAQPGMLEDIARQCGNGWRKVFNVYAKLLFALGRDEYTSGHDSWQSFRERSLLQKQSNSALLFSKPDFHLPLTRDKVTIQIIMGKHYALSLGLPEDLIWLDNEFAISTVRKIIVCPYFDYRQLSNIKIIRLVELIKQIS